MSTTATSHAARKLARDQELLCTVGVFVAAGEDPKKFGIPGADSFGDLKAHGFFEGSTPEDYGRACLRSFGEYDKANSRQECLKAGFSTLGALPKGIEHFLNFKLLRSFEATQDSMSGIREESTVFNFRENKRARLDHLTALGDVAPGGSAPHIVATMGTEETFRAWRKALQGVLDEQETKNFSWLAREIEKLGAVAARNYLLNTSWKPLLANDNLADETPFFDASRGNTADLALDETNLAATIALMNRQRSNGESTGHRAKYLVVSETLGFTARKLARLVKLDDDEDLIVRTEPRIDDGMIDPVTGDAIAGNTSRWFVFAGNFGPVDVAFMTPKPRVKTWPLDEGQYGLGWCVEWSLGSVGIDPRAAFRRQAP